MNTLRISRKEKKGVGGSEDPPQENFTLTLFIQYNVIKYTHRPKRLWQTKPFGPLPPV